MHKIFILSLFIALFVSCKSDSISPSSIEGVYTINKDSLKAQIMKNNEGFFAQSAADLVANATDVNVQITTDSVVGMLSLLGMDNRIESKLVTRNDSNFFLIDKEEVYLRPDKSGLKIEMKEFDILLEKMSGAKINEIKGRIKNARSMDLNFDN